MIIFLSLKKTKRSKQPQITYTFYSNAKALHDSLYTKVNVDLVRMPPIAALSCGFSGSTLCNGSYIIQWNYNSCRASRCQASNACAKHVNFMFFKLKAQVENREMQEKKSKHAFKCRNTPRLCCTYVRRWVIFETSGKVPTYIYIDTRPMLAVCRVNHDATLYISEVIWSATKKKFTTFLPLNLYWESNVPTCNFIHETFATFA